MSTKSKSAPENIFALKNPQNLSTDVYYGMSFLRLSPGLVISRDYMGSPACLFEDNIWSFPGHVFAALDVSTFSFSKFSGTSNFNTENIKLCKKIFLIKMFSPKSKTGEPLRLRSMQVVHMLLNRLSNYCNNENKNLEVIFSDLQELKQVIETLPPTMIKALRGIVSTLNKTESAERGFALTGEILAYTAKKCKQISKKTNQHPIIPSRILWEKYKQYKECIKDFNENYLNIKAFIKQANENPLYARGMDKKTRMDVGDLIPLDQRVNYLSQELPFVDAVRAHDLVAISKKYDWYSVSSVGAFLSTTQHCAKSLVHLLTLMRDHEVLELEVDCLEPIAGFNNDALYVVGISTKLTATVKDHKWITIPAIIEPIETLIKINKIIKPYIQFKEQSNKLFLSTSALPISNCSMPSDTSQSRSHNKGSRLPPIFIQEDDIRELESVDPMRDWRSDPKFKVGQPWRVTSHQFRRSMAVFSGQSELITLPSLKRMLQHLTKVMATYYMKGCSAQNYIFNLLAPELTLEIRNSKAEADSALFIREMLNPGQKLYGFHGKRIMQGTAENTMAQVKAGLIAYESSPFGGCTSLTPCNKRGVGYFFDCPGCDRLVGSLEVIDESIKYIEFDIEDLTPGTIEYKAELRTLDSFREARRRIIGKQLTDV
ncbi:hypothetical protein [Edaphovirga cremea]|uniref:hypothetical protein n=1 Tax=Edaphovirga cremea TaxID=2267246 RepID=UPI003989C5AC